MAPFRDPPAETFEAIANFRDLGGHQTTTGRRLRRGVLFRSGHLGRATDDDVAELQRLGIRRVFDFRTQADIAADGADRLPNGTQHVQLPMPDPAAGEDIRTLIAKNATDGLEEIFGNGRAEKLMTRGAAHIVRHRPEPYTRFMHGLCEADALPALFHCSAGKDRAGWAASVVLLAVDVPDDEVIEQYLLSNLAAERLRQNLTERDARTWGGVLQPLLEVRPEYIEASFEAMRERWGDFDSYLRDGLGVSEAQRDQLRAKLLE
ncbi:MAG: tyrosine-protein phosphatase [Candidatus Binatia bacterium]|nr:tyrosine-protein phosphatase [Candidatus Binatia bacterium]